MRKPRDRFANQSSVALLRDREVKTISSLHLLPGTLVEIQPRPGVPGGRTHGTFSKEEGTLAAKSRARRKFLHFFPDGFRDQTYIDWERGYKWNAHVRWTEELNATQFSKLLNEHKYAEIAVRAIRIESRTNLLFSFEKMALRDALRSRKGAQVFATSLFRWLHGKGALEDRFSGWCESIASLPRKQTRVLTWPLVSVFGFIAQPRTHIFLKPMVSRRAAVKYGFAFEYRSHPSWGVYRSFVQFAENVKTDLHDLKPGDMIDLQSFIWVQGSDEYDE